MRKFLSACILLSFRLAIEAQTPERIVSGTLRDDSGMPLPGVNIIVKGTTIGTTSDVEGRYFIKAPLGSILVFTFIGYSSQEMRVTEGNSESSQIKSEKNTQTIKKSVPKISAAKTPVQNKRGIAVLDDNSPTYKIPTLPDKNQVNQQHGIPEPIDNIRFLSPKEAVKKYGATGQNGMYVLQKQGYSLSPSAWSMSLNTSFTFDEVNKLSALQSQFAQGRPRNGAETWQSGENQEVFSWGPKIANLEFDGQGYDFDKNGRLVLKGNGNSTPAKIYNPYQFFRTGFTTNNSISISKSVGQFYFQTGFSSQKQQSVISGQSSDKTSLHIKIKTSLIRNIKNDFSINFSETRNRLPSQGAGMMNLMAAVMTTPVTFDNANGFSRHGALQNPSSYHLADNKIRTYAPGLTDNPFGLVNGMPDSEKTGKMISYLNSEWNHGYLTVRNNLGLEVQAENYIFGLPVGSAGFRNGRLTERTEKIFTFNNTMNVQFYRNTPDYHANFKANLTYNLAFQSRNLSRKDAFDFAENLCFTEAGLLSLTNILQERWLHEPHLQLAFDYDNTIIINFGNRSYFSSTRPSGKFFLPNVGLAFNSNNLINGSVFNSGKIRFSYSQNTQEAPLLYRKWNYNSTNVPVSQYHNYFESQEIPFLAALQPELSNKLETGLDLNFFNGKVTAEIDVYRNFTRNALVPVWNGSRFTLENAADLLTKGFEVHLQYGNYGGTVRWNTELIFSRQLPQVKSLHNNKERLPVAGFADASMNLVAGQPYGIIYGTTFFRNNAGQLLIDSEGFPVKDPVLKPIGNPNPAWTASIINNLSWKNLRVNMIWDFRRGGMIWNGTRQLLNYLGRSENTAANRNVRIFIYEGVLQNGSSNNIPVDFANPADGLEGNRWVRYGQAGVGEEAIEKGGWVRLNELKFSYNFPTKWLKKGEKNKPLNINVSLIGKNLLLITPYSGTDPMNTLLGYNGTNGMDLFNAPATRSYGLALSIKL